MGTDGIVRAVGGHTPELLGQDLSGVTLFKHFASDSAGWFYTKSVLTDRVPRLITYRRVEHYPLIVTIGRSSDEIFFPEFMLTSGAIFSSEWR